MISPCPWGQCEHSPNAHGLDHCHACHCVKPPPPPPTPAPVEETELEVITAEVCGSCAAMVDDREKHVARHERDLDRITNLVLTLGDLQRKVDRLQEQIGALDRAHAELDRQINRKPEF